MILIPGVVKSLEGFFCAHAVLGQRVLQGIVVRPVVVWNNFQVGVMYDPVVHCA